MLHDPEIYDSPMEFIPERFNGDDVEMAKVTDLVFGFWPACMSREEFRRWNPVREHCHGACDMPHASRKNEAGEEVLPKYAYTTGMIGYVSIPA